MGIVLDACPNLLWLVKDGGGIRNWREFTVAAEVARPIMGISPSAWEEAQVAMGEQAAAITLAGIYQKQDQIKSPGGYLRSLTERAREGKFSAWPMIMALLRAKLEAAKVKGSGLAEAESELDTAERVVRTEKRLEISDTLRQTMAKWDRDA